MRFVYGWLLFFMMGSLLISQQESPFSFESDAFAGRRYVQQDSAIRIGYGETVSGSLDSTQFRALYIFSGRQGEIITISMSALDGDLDPYLSLVDGPGRGIAFSDDNGGSSARIDSLRLPTDGDYFIIATRFGHEQGSTSGSYELRLDRLGATTSSGATIRYGDTVIGEINAQQPQIIYVFSGQRGEVINLRMLRTSGNLDAMIDLANPQGQILRTGDDDPNETGTLNAAILNFALPQTGYYIVVATRYGRTSGTTQGSYLLSLETVPEEQLGRSPANARLLDYGQNVSGTIDSDVPQRFYQFEGSRGDVVSIDMQRTAGNLNTVLLLLDSQLGELARAGGDQPFNRAHIIGYTLPQDGRYFIMASRVDFSDGETDGEFSLELTGRPGLGGSEFLEIIYDAQQQGVISDALPFENYVFQGEAGDVITIRMDRISDNLDPLLTLYQDNKQIAFDDDSGDGNNAAIIDFTLPEDGIYRIEAARFDRDRGSTFGSYILTLEAR